MPETCAGEELLGAVLGTGDHCGGLRAGPFERLLDLGAGGVRQLGRLVARLLEQPCAAGLGLAELLRRIAFASATGVRDSLRGQGRVQDL